MRVAAVREPDARSGAICLPGCFRLVSRVINRTHSFCRLDEVCLEVPSYDKEKPGFSPNRYWREPIWVNINWLLYHGLRCYGLDDYARRGHGADRFSWTAALVLDLLYEEEDPAQFA